MKKSEQEFCDFMRDTYSVKVMFFNGQLYVPAGQGHSVPVIVYTAWNAWKEGQKKVDSENEILRKQLIVANREARRKNRRPLRPVKSKIVTTTESLWEKFL